LLQGHSDLAKRRKTFLFRRCNKTTLIMKFVVHKPVAVLEYSGLGLRVDFEWWFGKKEEVFAARKE